MKSLFKVTLLATTMAVALNAPLAMAADAAQAKPAAAPQQAPKNAAFKNDDQQSAYALGASLGRYMENSLKEQEKLGITLDKTQLIAGVQDAFAGKSKLSDQEIEQTLQSFEGRVKGAAQAKMEKDATENASKGDAYAAKFAKEKGVKKTESGLLYQVEKEGTGSAPTDSDTVVVNYKGTLIDGTEFDNSYTRGEPLSFRLDGVIPGWTEGLKHVKKGGKIKLVIPPNLAYGKNGVPGIPANSTLVFDVELLDIKAAAKADAAPAPAAPAAGDAKAKQ
ncbi:FKBP-type peptidyl-prolyl cis-trans isomerase [Erwinia aphidicola]|jgi:FKBP-type peptidyl-prolyl cis-trans isomerase FkpA|uniref:Peptidyl-prolyl cis-trans isomerase n=1 Tax=Erwinia aphidicola TaxID=68334 RepID=A0ABU8DCM9_ERWAP|nr:MULTISPECIES: FKBP-type peptidyl-prolyl cis-trans isomerase [Erwinia]KMV68423.1 peptidylprolyl isomerase [bacteria symbiont BFo1 of Frankliniella occidentalis]PIJ55693.1 FKBP-type peptidyl-prolyl cis-trans isomerase FkpA [Erwinia sp. OLMDLW33]VTT29271.1 FKBP-type peptidyl-prolyl cis-trans isomerase FkpA [Klebsiella pneumoniae]KYP88053.1 peptidylprolyl isomerase [bacteria symbiont BFo1 of Frankliniella occidentalis]MBD1377893.1 FKBP-type peptidyl-prolyl cis-trans isomerase [Erwinia aphidicol